MDRKSWSRAVFFVCLCYNSSTHPTDEQLRLLDISSKNNLPSVLLFFQCRNIFRRAFPYKKFVPSKSVCIIFFSEITHNPSPLKSQMVGPLQKMNCLNMALKTMSFSIFKKSIIIHKQKTKEINVECVFLSDKDRTKLYVHFFRPE